MILIKKIKNLYALLALLLSIVLFHSCLQSNESAAQNRILQSRRELKAYGVPDESVHILRSFSFPNDAEDKEKIFLKKAQSMTISETEEVYLCDSDLNQIIIFDKNNKFAHKFGKYGQGPGELTRPYYLAFFKNNDIIVYNSGNARLDIFDRQDKFIRSMKIFKTYSSIVTDKKRNIYASPIAHNYDEVNYLVDVIDENGHTEKSFGLPLKFKYHSGTLNRVGLRINRKNEVFVYWLFLNLMRRYSPEGDLIREYKVMESALLASHTSANEHAANQKNANKFRSTIRSIWVDNDSIYLFSYDPRIEILEYDYEGKLKEYYWTDQEYDAIYSDIFVKESEGKKIFYILEVYPDNRVNVFQKK
jgi:hypothetical protein